MVNAITERNSPVLNFVYYQFQTLTDQFADVNGKQPMSLFSFVETANTIVAW